MKNQKEIPYNLIAKKISDKLSEDENMQLDKYLSETENIEDFKEFEQIWENSDFEEIDFDVNSALSETKDKILSNEKKTKHVKRQMFYYSVAAVSLLFIMLSYFYVYQKPQKNDILTQYKTHKNEKKDITLADGTIISLNESSELQISANFNEKQRIVFFSGEAYFVVAHNSEKPFIIKYKNTEVKVLGTEFNINTKNKIKVNLTEGKVKFTDVKNDKSAYLVDNEALEYDSENLNLRKLTVYNRNYMAWKTGILEFDNETLENVALTLQKYYQLDNIIVQESIKHQKLTGKYENLSKKEVFEIISMTMNLDVSEKNNEMILKKK